MNATTTIRIGAGSVHESITVPVGPLGSKTMFSYQAILGILATMILASLLTACTDDAGADPTVDNAWARPGDSGDNSAAYMDITNDGDADLTLVGVSGDVAGAVEVHESGADDEGMMQMEEIPELVIEAGETVSLEPGGYHIMMMDLEQDLAVGDTFQITLEFEEHDDVELDVTVEEQ